MILLLRGDTELIPFEKYMKSFAGWLSADSVLKLRFEDIIGPNGNGTLEAQQSAFHRIVKHIGILNKNEQIETAISNAFNIQAGTFFKGKIGAWKEGFSDTVKEALNENAEGLLREWHYL